jgi:hypothetical protein
VKKAVSLQYTALHFAFHRHIRSFIMIQEILTQAIVYIVLSVFGFAIADITYRIVKGCQKQTLPTPQDYKIAFSSQFDPQEKPIALAASDNPPTSSNCSSIEPPNATKAKKVKANQSKVARSVGAAALDFNKMNVRQLRSYCQGDPRLAGYSQSAKNKAALQQFIRSRLSQT